MSSYMAYMDPMGYYLIQYHALELQSDGRWSPCSSPFQSKRHQFRRSGSFAIVQSKRSECCSSTVQPFENILDYHVVGGLDHVLFFHHIWVVILPIVSYFSRWLLHHQPDVVLGISIHSSNWLTLATHVGMMLPPIRSP